MNDLAILQQSFEHFNQATADLQRAYASLEEKFAQINRELEQKNSELVRTITEKEDMKNYLQNILESLASGVIVTDVQERIQTVNRYAESLFDVPQRSVLGRQLAALFGDAFPEKEGAIRFADYIQAETGRKVRLTGKTMEIFGAPVTDRNGTEIGTVFIMRDITRMEKLEEMAKRTEKFAAMGEMAANIAHEIRNPLGSIELFASLLSKDLTEKKDRDRLAQIISSVKNMDNKISNLLLFTRNRAPMLRKVDIHDILKEIRVFSAQIFAQGNIAFSLRCADGEAVADGDAEMLKQVFFNLILNALQAMPEGGSLSIETRFPSPGGNGRAKSATIEIRFTDSGVGIAAENRNRIFDPFFSTREGGSGLGLAIVHNIIDMHGGAITVEQGEQGGTIFAVLLPLTRGEE